MSFQKPKSILKQMFDKLDKIINILISIRGIHTIPRFDRIWRIEGGRNTRGNVVILCVTGLLLLLGLNGSAHSQPPTLPVEIKSDTVDIYIETVPFYPGTQRVWLEVLMKNPIPVSGYHFMLVLSNINNVAEFCIDDAGVCIIDTTGCLVGFLGMPYCQGGKGWANTGIMGEPRWIPPDTNPRPLFRICMNVCCIPDSMNDRSTFVWCFPDSCWILDQLGRMVPFGYRPGELIVWWSLPGDANGDSLVDISDVIFLTNYLFVSGPEPCVCEAADCDNSCTINGADLVYLINYLFFNGPAPIPGCAYCRHEHCWL
jgi:hypothetical protein